MNRILIITQYFEPCTLTPSQRITYWAKNFHKLGFYPTIITREWTKETKSHFDTKRPLGDKLRHEKFPEYEVYYLPFKPGILDRGYLKFGESIFRPIFLLIKFLDVLLASITLRFTSYRSLEKFAVSLVKKDHFKTLLISGAPFYLFRIGWALKKKFGLNWVADYRDDWSTNELQMAKSGGFVRKWISHFEANYERKWVGTAKAIISVSELYTKRIADFLGKPGITIQNGFEEGLLELPELPLFDQFTVIYSGILYPSQNLEPIIKVLELCYNKQKPFRLVFLGAGYDRKERIRIQSIIPDHLKPYVEITDRFPRHEAIEKLQKAHVLLGIAYGNIKGIPSSKLYEYLALGKPILLCPTDGDLMESILREAGLGFFAKTAEEGEILIRKLQDLYRDGRSIATLKENSKEVVFKYNRFNQMEAMKSLLG